MHGCLLCSEAAPGAHARRSMAGLLAVRGMAAIAKSTVTLNNGLTIFRRDHWIWQAGSRPGLNLHYQAGPSP
ncbi:Uncharacterised protein [Bordetella pertussis]|nr:Uncharacterised protein [Bordetella pertussis]